MRQNLHNRIHIFSLALLAGSIPVSLFMMSLSQIILAANWFLEGNLKEKFNRIFQNKILWIFVSVFLIHLIGMIWTSDIEYGLHDLKIKIPILALPILLAGRAPVSSNEIKLIFGTFIGSIIISIVLSLFQYARFGNRIILDPRDLSLFISHIRFSLFICFGIFVLISFFVPILKKRFQIPVYLIIGGMILFLIILESITGLIAFFITGFIWAIFHGWKKQKVPLILFMLTGVLSVFFLLNYMNNIRRDLNKINKVDFSKLEFITANGNVYHHTPQWKEMENGNYIGLYRSYFEMNEEWKKRSILNLDSADKKGNHLETTLARYLTSKGLRKDASGVDSLTDQEIIDIENGIPNYKYKDLWSLELRIHQIIWEFDRFRKGIKPEGHSVTGRLAFWQAGFGIFKENLLFGVGTGDVKNEFIAEYERIKSPLNPKFRHRAHNQFLTFAITFGIIGCLVIFIAIIYSFSMSNYLPSSLKWTFFGIILISMLAEDTLETQAGVTFFAFFSSMFLTQSTPSKRELHRD